jgi:hypothetical protein
MLFALLLERRLQLGPLRWREDVVDLRAQLLPVGLARRRIGVLIRLPALLEGSLDLLFLRVAQIERAQRAHVRAMVAMTMMMGFGAGGRGRGAGRRRLLRKRERRNGERRNERNAADETDKGHGRLLAPWPARSMVT